MQRITRRKVARVIARLNGEKTPERCATCGTHVAHTEDWTLWPWEGGRAWLCSDCNRDRLGEGYR
jgi:hypothetical protein